NLSKLESLNAEQVAPDFGRSRHDEFEVATDGSSARNHHREVSGVRDGHEASVAGLGLSIRAPDYFACPQRTLHRACTAIATVRSSFALECDRDFGAGYH